MTRKRTTKTDKKNPPFTLKHSKNHLPLVLLVVIIIISIGTFALVQNLPDEEENKDNNDTVNEGKWLFAMDTPTERVGSNTEYSTGFIPTIIIIDVDGNIIHKSSGIHPKSDLEGYIETAKNPTTSDVIEQAPDFTLETLNGKEFKLSSNRGKPIILDMMAVRCPPCETQMTELHELKLEYKDEIIILSIDVDGAVGYETAQDLRGKYQEYIRED